MTEEIKQAACNSELLAVETAAIAHMFMEEIETVGKN